jgi:hypothetical protein
VCKFLEVCRVKFLDGVPNYSGKAVINAQKRSVRTGQDNTHPSILECRTESRLAVREGMARLNLFRSDFSE